jgi:hypothetical protein
VFHLGDLTFPARALRLPVGQELVVLVGEFPLGVLVVLLELLAQG